MSAKNIDNPLEEITYIDLTYTLDNNTASSPYDKPLHITQTKFLEIDHYNDSKLISTMHIGTHIDAPSHMTSSTKKIDDYPVETFIGRGVIMDFTGESIITLREHDKAKIKQGDIVLLYTGSEQRIGTNDYYDNHPILSEEFCNFLVQKKIKLVALDFFSPDKEPYNVHKTLLSNDILIVENIKNAHLLLEESTFKLFMIPLKIHTEGSFIRAFAEIKNSPNQ